MPDPPGNRYEREYCSAPDWPDGRISDTYQPMHLREKPIGARNRSCCKWLYVESANMCVAIFASIARCALILINTILAVVGLALIIVGAVLRFSKSVSKSLIQLAASSSQTLGRITGLDMNTITRLLGTAAKYINGTTIIFIAFGVIVLIISFVGLVGASRRSRCLLRIYLIFIGAIAFVLAILTIVLAVKKETIRKTGKNFLYNQFRKKYGNPKNKKFTEIFNALMEIFRCCGIVNGDDFRTQNTTWKFKNLDKKVPTSCCVHKGASQVHEKCEDKPTTINSHKTVGCYLKLWAILEYFSKKITIGLASMVAVLSIFIICTCLIIKNETLKIQREKENS